jgi:hypothetical protein
LRGGEADEAIQHVSFHLKGRGSFLKKRTKKLLLLVRARVTATGSVAKVFLLLFFQKKKRLLSLKAL